MSQAERKTDEMLLQTNLALKAYKETKLATNVAKEETKQEYKDKEKTKPLTDKERIDRIEKLLGLK